MLHEYFQKNDLNSLGNTFERPLRDLMELNARALQNFSFMLPADMLSSKKPEDMMERNMGMMFDNGRAVLGYMNSMLHLIEKNCINSMDNMTKCTASMHHPLKHTATTMMTEPTGVSKSGTMMNRSQAKRTRTMPSKPSMTVLATSRKTSASKTSTSMPGTMRASKTSTSMPGAMRASKTSTSMPGTMRASKTSTSMPGTMRASKTSTSMPGTMRASKTSKTSASMSTKMPASKTSTSMPKKTLASKSSKAPAYKSGVVIKSGSAKSTVIKSSAKRTSPEKKTSKMMATPAMKGKASTASDMKKLTSTTVSSPMPSSANQPVMKDMGIHTGSKGTI